MPEPEKIRLLDVNYVKLNKSERGKRVLKILKVLIKGKKSRLEITDQTGFSVSEVRRRLVSAEKRGLVEKYRKIVTKRPGKPVLGNFEKETGRPTVYYGLTFGGWAAVRCDPEIFDSWKEIGKKYGHDADYSMFDSYEDLMNGLKENPKLKTWKKAHYDILSVQASVFDPFIYAPNYKEKLVTEELYDEVIKVFRKNVRPEHLMAYYDCLEKREARLGLIIDRQKRLLEKMKQIPELKIQLQK